MLTACTEGGRAKSYKYWPDNVGKELVFKHRITAPPARPHHCADWTDGYLPSISVKYVSSTPSSDADGEANKGWRTNMLRLSQDGREAVDVRHIEYLGWQDHGVPDSPEEVLRLLGYLNSLPGADKEAIVTHCSAGVGRTGTFISIAWLVPLLARIRAAPPDQLPDLLQGLEQSAQSSDLGPLLTGNPAAPQNGESGILAAFHRIKDGKVAEEAFDPVMAVIDGCRDQRTTMVQTSKQVEFVYEVARLSWNRPAQS